LEPSFGTKEPQGQERATETNSMPQARIEMEEMPTSQVSIEVAEVSAQHTVEKALVAMQPPPIEYMEAATELPEVEIT